MCIMKHKAVGSKMMGVSKASAKMGKGMSGMMPLPKMGSSSKGKDCPKISVIG